LPSPTQKTKRPGRPARELNFIVTDDWPERVPVTKAEVDVFEAYFGDFIDELLGYPPRPSR